MKDAILKYLQLNSPVRGRNLLAYLNNCGYKVGNRTMRLAIVDLQKDGHLLISSSDGYSFARSPEEYREAINYWKSYAFDILEKVKQMEKNYQRAVKPQLFES